MKSWFSATLNSYRGRSVPFPMSCLLGYRNALNVYITKNKTKKMRKNRTIRLFFNYLIKGTLVVLPLAGALFLIVWIVASVDSALNLSGWFWEDEQGRPLYV